LLTEGRKSENRTTRARSREHDMRLKILDAAGQAFAQYGRTKTTVEDIIEAAGVARATVYKHFRTKDEIFKAVVERELVDVIASSREAAARAVGTREKLRAAILAQLHGVRGTVNLYRVTLKSLSEIGPPGEAEKERMAAPAQLLVKEILSEGVRTREIAIADVSLAARTVVMAYHGIVLQTMFSRTEELNERLVDTLLAMLFEGMLPRKEGG
jgi:AcrR family transcriptional regulator